ncbi:MAG TPA: ABC transporter ATP-binding protein [Bacillota bacterium]|nr:ABC transporter ATP-binding protein [Bacillota bacterium]
MNSTGRVIHLHNVSLERDDSNLLSKVNWEVKRGENWSILGLNGAGKSLLLNIVTGYLWPTVGDVWVLGHQFGHVDLRELRKSIGWVSSALQEKLYQNETAEEIVLSGRFATIGLYDAPEAEDRAEAQRLLELLDCTYLRERPYKYLSQGERQRVLIARALINDPKLLILDEPCTGLDVFARENLLATIQNLGSAHQAPTLIYVTHHLDEILPVFSHTLLLRKGQVYSAGPNAEVLTPGNLSGFFNSPVTVNWHQGRPHLLFNQWQSLGSGIMERR